MNLLLENILNYFYLLKNFEVRNLPSIRKKFLQIRLVYHTLKFFCTQLLKFKLYKENDEYYEISSYLLKIKAIKLFKRASTVCSRARIPGCKRSIVYVKRACLKGLEGKTRGVRRDLVGKTVVKETNENFLVTEA